MIMRITLPLLGQAHLKAEGGVTVEPLFRRHRLVLLPVIATVFALQAFGLEISSESMPILSVLFVLFFGMPHGAFDVALASRSWPDKGFIPKAQFIAEYLIVAALVILFWLTFPGEALCAFLGLSILHFSEDWEIELPHLDRTIVGAAIISFPALLHEGLVANIFAWLVPSSDAASLAHGLHVAALVLLPLAMAVVASMIANRIDAAAEIITLLALAIAVTPLTFFVIYFCGLHSIRHLGQVRAALQTHSRGSFIWLGLPYAAAAIIGVLGLSASFDMPLEGGLLRGLFIGLAALTVPHMLLVDAEDHDADFASRGRFVNA